MSSYLRGGWSEQLHVLLLSRGGERIYKIYLCEQCLLSEVGDNVRPSSCIPDYEYVWDVVLLFCGGWVFTWEVVQSAGRGGS